MQNLRSFLPCPCIRLSVSLVYLLKSIFISVSKVDYTGCFVSDKVGVLRSSVSRGECLLVSDKHLC